MDGKEVTASQEASLVVVSPFLKLFSSVLRLLS
jgi:hypothetical protein